MPTTLIRVCLSSFPIHTRTRTHTCTLGPQVEHDVERHVLSLTVRLSDGTDAPIYHRSNQRNRAIGVFVYDCRLCGVANLSGERCLQTHIAGRKHQSKLAQPFIDADTFRLPLQRNKPQSTSGWCALYDAMRSAIPILIFRCSCFPHLRPQYA